jgi:hypothetical protein
VIILTKEKEKWKSSKEFADSLSKVDVTQFTAIIQRFDAFKKIMEPVMFMLKAFNMEILTHLKDEFREIFNVFKEPDFIRQIRDFAKVIADLLENEVPWESLGRLIIPVISTIGAFITWIRDASPVIPNFLYGVI